MNVRAKFVCVSITRRQGWGPHPEIRDVKLNPVSGGSDENKTFFAASPSGEITLGCANVVAADVFQLGGEYYVDFSPAPRPAQPPC